MGRKSIQELHEKQLLNKSEIIECLTDSSSLYQVKDYEEFAFTLYQFTKLIYDNIK